MRDQLDRELQDESNAIAVVDTIRPAHKRELTGFISRCILFGVSPQGLTYAPGLAGFKWGWEGVVERRKWPDRSSIISER